MEFKLLKEGQGPQPVMHQLVHFSLAGESFPETRLQAHVKNGELSEQLDDAISTMRVGQVREIEMASHKVRVQVIKFGSTRKGKVHTFGAERIAIAAGYKQSGNQFLRAGVHMSALRDYSLGLGMVQGDSLAESQTLEAALVCNITLCYIKQGQYQAGKQLLQQLVDRGDASDKVWYRYFQCLKHLRQYQAIVKQVVPVILSCEEGSRAQFIKLRRESQRLWREERSVQVSGYRKMMGVDN